jgi:hypothetical protein
MGAVSVGAVRVYQTQEHTMERKHRDQMTDEEIDFLEYLLSAMSGWITEFALIHASKRDPDRPSVRNVTHVEILKAIKTGSVIELNSLARVLIRDKSGVIAVVSLCDRKVITMWRCNPRDTHKTLDRSLYKWKVNAIEYVKSLRSTR